MWEVAIVGGGAAGCSAAIYCGRFGLKTLLLDRGVGDGQLEQAAEITRKSITIGCTDCRYCTDGCPQSIPIPSLFTVYNDYRRFAALGKAQYVTEYKWATDKAGKASDCIGCRQCEEHCPQHLEITEWLKTIAETFE